MLSKQESYIALIGKFLACDKMPNGFSVDSGAVVMIFYFFKLLGKVALCCFNYSITAFKTACFLTNGLYHTTKFNYRYALYV